MKFVILQIKEELENFILFFLQIISLTYPLGLHPKLYVEMQMKGIPHGWFASVSHIILALLKSNSLSSCLQASPSMTPLRNS